MELSAKTAGRRRFTARRLCELFFLNLKNHRIRISKFWSIIFFASGSPVYCKKFDSIRTKLTKEIDFEVCPYGESGNGTAAAARRSAGYSDWTGGAAACSDRSSGAFRTADIRNWGRTELGAQSGRKNPPACLSVCLLARSQTWRAIIFSRVCLWVCLSVSLTGTSTLQR